MSRTSTGLFQEIFSADGDNVAPDFTFTDGWSSQYEVPVSDGGLPPERTTFNYLFNQLYSVSVDVNGYGGALPWDSSLYYFDGAVVTGSDGNLYIATSDNQNEDPVLEEYWIRYYTADDFSATTGATLITTSSSQNVQEELDSKATLSDFAANDSAANAGAAKIGLYLTYPVGVPQTQSTDVETYLGSFCKAKGFVVNSGTDYTLQTETAVNVSSIVRSSLGYVNVNFATDMPNNNYVVLVMGYGDATSVSIYEKFVSYFQVKIDQLSGGSGATPKDASFNFLVV